MNKLDGQYYAMKKILIKKVSKDDCMKVGGQTFINGHSNIDKYLNESGCFI